MYLGGVVLFEEFGCEEKDEEDEAEFVFIVLFVKEPAVEEDDLLKANGPEHHCFEVDDVLADHVLSPVSDG